MTDTERLDAIQTLLADDLPLHIIRLFDAVTGRPVVVVHAGVLKLAEGRSLRQVIPKVLREVRRLRKEGAK